MADSNPDQSVGIKKMSTTFGQRRSSLATVDLALFCISEDEFVTLLGLSGNSETALVCLIARFDDPTAGHIPLGDAILVTCNAMTHRAVVPAEGTLAKGFQ